MIRALAVMAAMILLPAGIATAGAGSHWAYDGKQGPEHWGELSEEYAACAAGRNQSPIDLVADVDADLPALSFDYDRPGIIEELDTGHSIQENARPGNYLTFLGERFELKQLHFHSPSEHRVGGKSFPMEFHLVHTNEAGKIAVVGLLFSEGDMNPLLEKLPAFRAARGAGAPAVPLDFDEVVSERERYFVYNGSLTTPPCSEGVTWIVVKQPVEASGEQIKLLHDMVGSDTNRPIQPHNARIVLD
jgi:carbonic anhydrase